MKSKHFIFGRTFAIFCGIVFGLIITANSTRKSTNVEIQDTQKSQEKKDTENNNLSSEVDENNSQVDTETAKKIIEESNAKQGYTNASFKNVNVWKNSIVCGEVNMINQIGENTNYYPFVTKNTTVITNLIDWIKHQEIIDMYQTADGSPALKEFYIEEEKRQQDIRNKSISLLCSNESTNINDYLAYTCKSNNEIYDKYKPKYDEQKKLVNKNRANVINADSSNPFIRERESLVLKISENTLSMWEEILKTIVKEKQKDCLTTL